MTGTDLACMCSGCAACTGLHQHEFRHNGNPGDAPPFCADCTREYQAKQTAKQPAQATRRAPAPLERRSAPRGRNNMGDELSQFFGTLAGGVSRHVTIPEAKGLHAQAAQLEAEAAIGRARFTVIEPVTYQRGGPNSFFADIVRISTGYGDKAAASKRLERHESELAAFYPAWREARARAASQAYEKAFASDWRGQALLERMEKFGLSRFTAHDAFEKSLERRAINRTDGNSGYFVPPLWILEDWAMAPRAGRPFADACWTSIPLPAGTDSVNVPHWVTGTATGPQSADGASTSTSSAADSYANSTVQTISGYQDVAMQFAEQTAPPGADAFVFKDLMDDASQNLDAQLLIGSGTSGTLKGIILSGAASANNHVLITNGNTANASFVFSGTGSTIWASVARMLKVMSKARRQRPTHIVMNESTWWDLAAVLDASNRPILPMTADAPQPGPDGVLGSAWGLPVCGTNNLPLTFGGATAPTVATSGAQFSYTDGNGSYGVICAVRAPDLYLFEGPMRVRVMQQVTSGTLQWRYQIEQYAAAIRDRYTYASTITVSAGSDTGGINTGGTPSAGVTTNYESGSPLASE